MISARVEDCTITTTDDNGKPYEIRVSGDDITVSRRGEGWTGTIVYGVGGERFVGIEWSENEGESEPDANEVDMVEQLIAGN